MQTPQVFKLSLLRKAYEQKYVGDFTDDASVVESISEKITLTSGNVENIKLTTPHELLLAEALINGYGGIDKKKEGDGKTPTGLYGLSVAFGKKEETAETEEK